MTHEEFDGIVAARLETIGEVLTSKGREYARGGDRLSNFKNGAMLLRCTPAEACLGYMAKQFASIVDLVLEAADGVDVQRDAWDEKIGDAINYLILLEAIVKEKP